VGDAVELEFLDGGTSGRFGVARYASGLFPRIAAEFVERVKSESALPAEDLALGIYPADSVRYADSMTAEFSTPPNKTGLGTQYNLAPSRDGIRGLVVLDPSAGWAMWIFRLRVGTSMSQLGAALLRLNKECLKNRGC